MDSPAGGDTLEILSLTANTSTTIFWAPSKNRKAWTLDNNPRFLIDQAIRVFIAIIVYDAQTLDRGLMVVVFVINAAVQQRCLLLFSYRGEPPPDLSLQ